MPLGDVDAIIRGGWSASRDKDWMTDLAVGGNGFTMVHRARVFIP
jgi:hypothetical protein